MEIIVAIIFMILSFVLENSNMRHLSILIFNIGYWIASIERIKLCKEELLIMGYPEYKLKNTDKYAILFDWRNKKDQKMPKEIIQIVILITVELVIFSILILISRLLHNELLLNVFWIYPIIGLLTAIILLIKATKIAFYTKYKRLTWHNLKYLCWCPSDWTPKKIKLGKCKVKEEQVKGKKQYYIVEMCKSGYVYEKVLYCGEGVCDKTREHTLYEICKVNYMY